MVIFFFFLIMTIILNIVILRIIFSKPRTFTYSWHIGRSYIISLCFLFNLFIKDLGLKNKVREITVKRRRGLEIDLTQRWESIHYLDI